MHKTTVQQKRLKDNMKIVFSSYARDSQFNPPVVTGICDPKKSRAWQHHRYGSILIWKYNKTMTKIWTWPLFISKYEIYGDFLPKDDRLLVFIQCTTKMIIKKWACDKIFPKINI